MVKQSKVVFQQPKTLENLNTVNIKSAIIEMSHKLFKTLRQTEKVPHVSSSDKNNHTFTKVVCVLIMMKF